MASTPSVYWAHEARVLPASERIGVLKLLSSGYIERQISLGFSFKAPFSFIFSCLFLMFEHLGKVSMLPKPLLDICVYVLFHLSCVMQRACDICHSDTGKVILSYIFQKFNCLYTEFSKMNNVKSLKKLLYTVKVYIYFLHFCQRTYTFIQVSVAPVARFLSTFCPGVLGVRLNKLERLRAFSG